MLELSKEILLKVSFDQYLFRKELLKALKWIRKDERTHLKLWVYQKFGKKYPEIIKQTFRDVDAA